MSWKSNLKFSLQLNEMKCFFLDDQRRWNLINIRCFVRGSCFHHHEFTCGIRQFPVTDSLRNVEFLLRIEPTDSPRIFHHVWKPQPKLQSKDGISREVSTGRSNDFIQIHKLKSAKNLHDRRFRRVLIVDVIFIVRLFWFLLHYYQKMIGTVADKVELNNLHIVLSAACIKARNMNSIKIQFIWIFSCFIWKEN
jgi:hypothetical protein